MLTPLMVDSTADTLTPGTFRSAVAAANFNTDVRDEIIFDSSLFTSGTPIITLSSTISISVPSWIHSQFGDVILRNASSTQEALFLQPALTQGIGQDFEIENLQIEDFTYGIHINDTGGTPDSSVEGVKIADNIFKNNERAIYLEDSLYPFEIRDNQISGIQGTPTPNDPNEAGIWIENPSTVTNTFNPVIDNNMIVDNEDYGIIVLGASIPNLTISNNSIGIDNGSAAANGFGIVIQDNETQIGAISGNEIAFNSTNGIAIIGADSVTINGDNTIRENGGYGVLLTGSSNDNLIEGNTFDSNVLGGVGIGTSTPESTRNRISQNRYIGSGASQLPIDHKRNGIVEANDVNDTDEGPNRGQNYPEILFNQVADEGTQWRVPVQFDGFQGSPFELEFYRYSPSLQEYIYIRTETVPGDLIAGEATSEFLFQKGTGPTDLRAGDHLAALAITTVGGDTSELVRTTAPLQDGSAPRVRDVRLDGSGWTGGAQAFSYKDIVTQGNQLRPLYRGGVNQVIIEFTEAMTAITKTSLSLSQTTVNVGGGSTTIDDIQASSFQTLSANTFMWTFSTLPDGKFALHLTDTVTDLVGKKLDGEWLNAEGGDPDNYSNDPAQNFYDDVGNGASGGLNGEFRFHFSLLAGDYNQNGVVEAVTLGLDDLNSVKDGDGDGNVDLDDVTYAQLRDGNLLPLRAIGGADLNDDEIVDGEDLAIWQSGFGGFSGDIDGDGDSDGADFILWNTAFTDQSAWYDGTTGLAGTGGSAPLFTIGAAPQVTNVTISGSTSLHNPFSFDTVDGSGTQLQTVPVGGADTISITFSEMVNISADSLTIVGLQTANTPVLAEFSYNVMTMTATWRFEGWSLGDQYVLSMYDSVTDIEGNLLDGEWVNPARMSTVDAMVSEFPSGEGTAGGHFNFLMTLLAGDANLDGLVDGADAGILISNLGVSIGALFADADFNGDGIVDGADLSALTSKWGVDLQNVWVLADLDGDYIVDDTDLAVITSHYGMAIPTYADGDLNGDGIINDADLDLAFEQFGLGFDWVA